MSLLDPDSWAHKALGVSKDILSKGKAAFDTASNVGAHAF